MGHCRTVWPLTLAALLLCLPGSGYAREVFPDDSSRTQTVRIPDSAASPSRIEVDVGYSADRSFRSVSFGPRKSLYVSPPTGTGGWELTVTLDTEKCEISCTYRRLRDAYGRTLTGLLLPPSVKIRVYPDSVRKPVTLVIDPSGVTLPAATSHYPAREEAADLPGKKFLSSVPARGVAFRQSASVEARVAVVDVASRSAQLIPLRI